MATLVAARLAGAILRRPPRDDVDYGDEVVDLRQRAGINRWLMIIVQRRAIDKRRRKGARRETYLDAAIDVPASSALMDAAERADSDEALRQAVSLLPSAQRESFSRGGIVRLIAKSLNDWGSRSVR